MRTIEEIKYEMRETGYIIDDRSLHKIPFYPYVQEYAKLTLEIYGAITDGISLDRLEEICQAERDGRCVVLPVASIKHFEDNGYESWSCTVCGYERKGNVELNYCPECAKRSGVLPCKEGDLVYVISSVRDNFDDTPRLLITQSSFRLRMVDKIGKTVFLTREAAEAALKEATNEHDT